jgi:hypothetical protein
MHVDGIRFEQYRPPGPRSVPDRALLIDIEIQTEIVEIVSTVLLIFGCKARVLITVGIIYLYRLG